MRFPIFLCGFMASGKSSFGEKLARHLAIKFLETDALVEEKSGLSIDELFDLRGEEYFRTIEKQVLREIDYSDRCVISLGGGTICNNESLDFVKSKGTLFYLRLELPILIGRLRKNREKRPMTKGLSDEAIADLVKNKMHEREPYYLRADHIVEIQNLKLTEFVSYFKLTS